MEKRGEKTLKVGSNSKEQMARDQSHSIPTDNPSAYRGKVEGIERKESLTLLDEKANVTDSEYWIGQD